jgi:hypothetical protein
MSGINKYSSILILHIMVSIPQSRSRLASGIKKQDPIICCLQESYLIHKDKQWLKVKGQKKIFQANLLCKQAGIVIFISDKVDFKSKLLRRHKKVTPY